MIHVLGIMTWPITGYLIGEDHRGITDVIVGVGKVCMSYFLFIFVVEKLCAGVKDKAFHSKDGGKAYLEEIFVMGMGVFAITLFLVFEAVGCVASSSSTNIENELYQDCSMFLMANTSFAISIVFVQLAFLLAFNHVSATDFFTFNLERWLVLALG
jgi:hypothetical protein